MEEILKKIAGSEEPRRLHAATRIAGREKCGWCGKNEVTAYEFEIDGEVQRLRDICQNCREADNEEANRQRLLRLAREWSALCPPAYRTTNPGHPGINQRILGRLLEWDPVTAKGIGIGLYGPTGGGKTRKMFLLLKALHFAGVSVCYAPAGRFGTAIWRLASFRQADETSSDKAEREEAAKFLRRCKSVPVLFLDDLGKDRLTECVESNLFELVEQRTSQLKPILWTSNLNGSEIAKLMSSQRGAAIVRRLREFSDAFEVIPLPRKKPRELELPQRKIENVAAA